MPAFNLSLFELLLQVKTFCLNCLIRIPSSKLFAQIIDGSVLLLELFGSTIAESFVRVLSLIFWAVYFLESQWRQIVYVVLAIFRVIHWCDVCLLLALLLVVSTTRPWNHYIIVISFSTADYSSVNRMHCSDAILRLLYLCHDWLRPQHKRAFSSWLDRGISLILTSVQKLV